MLKMLKFVKTLSWVWVYIIVVFYNFVFIIFIYFAYNTSFEDNFYYILLIWTYQLIVIISMGQDHWLFLFSCICILWFSYGEYVLPVQCFKILKTTKGS